MTSDEGWMLERERHFPHWVIDNRLNGSTGMGSIRTKTNITNQITIGKNCQTTLNKTGKTPTITPSVNLSFVSILKNFITIFSFLIISKNVLKKLTRAYLATVSLSHHKSAKLAAKSPSPNNGYKLKSNNCSLCVFCQTENYFPILP